MSSSQQQSATTKTKTTTDSNVPPPPAKKKFKVGTAAWRSAITLAAETGNYRGKLSKTAARYFNLLPTSSVAKWMPWIIDADNMSERKNRVTYARKALQNTIAPSGVSNAIEKLYEETLSQMSSGLNMPLPLTKKALMKEKAAEKKGGKKKGNGDDDKAAVAEEKTPIQQLPLPWDPSGDDGNDKYIIDLMKKMANVLAKNPREFFISGGSDLARDKRVLTFGFILPPRRSDPNSIVITKKTPPETREGNFYVIDEKAFVFSNFKTAKTFGRQVFQLNQKHFPFIEKNVLENIALAFEGLFEAHGGGKEETEEGEGKTTEETKEGKGEGGGETLGGGLRKAKTSSRTKRARELASGDGRPVSPSFKPTPSKMGLVMKGEVPFLGVSNYTVYVGRASKQLMDDEEPVTINDLRHFWISQTSNMSEEEFIRESKLRLFNWMATSPTTAILRYNDND